MNEDRNRVRSALIPVVAFFLGKAIACCREAGRLTSEARDRALTTRERISMRIHNRLCGQCKRYARHLDIIGEISRESRPLPPLPAAAKRRLAEALRAEDRR